MNFKKFLVKKEKISRTEQIKEFLYTQEQLGKQSHVFNLINFSKWDEIYQIFEKTMKENQ